MIEHSACTNTAVTTGNHTDWYRNVARRGGAEQIDVTFGGTHNERLTENGEDDLDRDNSQPDADEMDATTSGRMLREGHQAVDWVELESARAALQSDDDGASTWESDDEEPELRNLCAVTSCSVSGVESNNSDDYDEEKVEREDEVCECNDKFMEESHQVSDQVANEKGTFDEVCLTSSTYYFACSDINDVGGLLLLPLLYLCISHCDYLQKSKTVTI